MARRGRPPEYTKHVPLLAKHLARQGLTNKEISGEIGVSTKTLYQWIKLYPELGEALKEGKMVPDAEVIDSLYKRATGYEVNEKKITTDSKGTVTKIEVISKHIAPDTTAIIFWACNRMPKDWKNVSRHEVTGADGTPLNGCIDVSTMSDEQLESELSKLEKLNQGGERAALQLVKGATHTA